MNYTNRNRKSKIKLNNILTEIHNTNSNNADQI